MNREGISVGAPHCGKRETESERLMNTGTIMKTGFAYVLCVIVTYVLSVAFYTQQVIAKMAAIGAVYSQQQQINTFVENFTGLFILAATIAVAFIIAFPVAYLVKRYLLKPLAPIAYPVAGGAAMLAMLWLIEQQLGGGAGIIGGARDATGLALQALAGALGGVVFMFKRPR